MLARAREEVYAKEVDGDEVDGEEVDVPTSPTSSSNDSYFSAVENMPASPTSSSIDT